MLEQLILTMALDNPSWGYLRLAGALKNLGFKISKSTVSNILKNNGINPSGDREHGDMSWADFIRLHKDIIWASDFFATEVWTKFGLFTYYVLFFINISSRRIVIGGITESPNGEWMAQIARNLTGFDGELCEAKYLIHDRDTKYTEQFDAIMKGSGIKPIRLPPQSPNLNPVAERFVLSAKSECIDHMIFIGEKSLRKTISEYVCHYHGEHPHQGLDNSIPFPNASVVCPEGKIKRKERLGGLLQYYYREAA